MSESRVETPTCEIDSLTTCPDCHLTFLSWQYYYHQSKCPKEVTKVTIHRHYTFQRHHSDEDLEICLTLHDLPEDTPEEESRLKAWEIVRSEVVRGGGWFIADVETQVCA